MLEALGARVVRIATIRIAPPADWAPLDRAIDSIDDYNFLVFTSVNAVDYFVSRLTLRRPGGANLSSDIVVCAIGSTTARSARELRLRVDLVAETSHAEGLLTAIVQYAGGEEALRGSRFLLPRSSIARDLLLDELRRMGAVVDPVEAYRTLVPTAERDDIIRDLSRQPVDAVTFTSPSTVNNFVTLVGRERLHELLAGAIVVCIGPVTAKAAVDHGFQNVVSPEEHNAGALVDEILARLG
jgi:uroporphyrinogen III methyltransferase/synthase